MRRQIIARLLQLGVLVDGIRLERIGVVLRHSFIAHGHKKFADGRGKSGTELEDDRIELELVFLVHNLQDVSMEYHQNLVKRDTN